MERNTIMSDVELSYEELQCLEANFRRIRGDAVVDTLRHSPVETLVLLDKIVSLFRSVNQREYQSRGDLV